MYIPQRQIENLTTLIEPQKVVIVYGPRRCGKTTLIKKFLETKTNEQYLFVTAEDLTAQEFLTSQRVEKLRQFVGNNKIIAIDEAQRIPNIGINLKLMIDHIPEIKIIASGSSSFDLAKQVGEPLTGRKYTLVQFPISQMELAKLETTTQTADHLEERLIFGSYPEILVNNDRERKIRYLNEIVSSYLYKDILELDNVRNSDKILKLLQLLCYQIGHEVSLTELGANLGMSKNTIERYLDLLEKTFVIFKLRSLSRNPRKEISKSNRYYFYDIGIRNTLINNYNPLSIRNDIGMLWENYVIMERLKKQEYTHIYANNFYWRTYSQKEIDFIEEREGNLFGYEIKWQQKNLRILKLWQELYPRAKYQTITKENYLDFIT